MKARVWFEALGRSAYSRGLSLNSGRASRVHWPAWARSAWARGWLAQGQHGCITPNFVIFLAVLAVVLMLLGLARNLA